MKHREALLFGVAIILAGCSTPPPWQGFNPHQEWSRPVVEPPEDHDEDEPVASDPQPPAGIRLSLDLELERPDQADAVVELVKSALAASAPLGVEPGAVTLLAKGPDRTALIEYSIGRGGPFTGREPIRVRSYELRFTASIRDSMAPMRVVWTGPGGKRTFELSTSKQVRLLERGRGVFQLVMTPKKPLTVKGEDLLPQGKGSYGFRTLPFKLQLKRGKKWFKITIKPRTQKAKVLLPRRLRTLRIDGFHGDMRRFLHALLGKNHPHGEAGEKLIGLRLLHADLWLEARVRDAPPKPKEADDDDDDDDDDSHEESGDD